MDVAAARLRGGRRSRSRSEEKKPTFFFELTRFFAQARNASPPSRSLSLRVFSLSSAAPEHANQSSSRTCFGVGRGELVFLVQKGLCVAVGRGWSVDVVVAAVALLRCNISSCVARAAEPALPLGCRRDPGGRERVCRSRCCCDGGVAGFVARHLWFLFAVLLSPSS